ncbi:penicillin-binding protein 1C [Chitinivorax tropicus]|uniref:peptidoglycan glycosyltransferase n=1 Tax=Chitinivorax tropicus TaxID=714531 RepID=A0A840MUD7_9PROT|nr:penicillin-binding protein 1C [Chitinivorax tropicus]MBB5019986.1 penicillin-binding protein 1C [Chitinivorax tropicus]
MISLQRPLLLLCTLLSTSSAFALPAFQAVRQGWQPSESWLLDRRGAILASKRINPHVRRLEWVSLPDISPELKKAVILSEDRRFLEHSGIDWQALAGAAKEQAEGGNRGASTLTMQLAGLLDEDLKAGPDGRSLLQKLGQIRAAKALEADWSKDQILEGYLNLAPFRGEAIGVAAASTLLFGKMPAGLNQGESIILAVLLRGPNASADTISRRACELANAMQARVGCAYLQGLASQALSLANKNRLAINDAPEVAQRLLDQAGRSVKSTLDADLQRAVREILHRQLADLQRQNTHNAAGLVIDNRSGQVLAYVSENLDRSQVDGVQAKRQAGSTLKPFLYQMAFAQRLLTPASLLDDSPVNIDTAGGLYMPQNYDKSFRGTVSVRTSLAGSLNLPAIRTLLLVGIEPFYKHLNALGLDLPQSADFYGFSLALGSADVSLWQLTNAYRTLANQGQASTPTLIPGNRPRGVQVSDGAASWLVGDILSDRGARASSFGLENPLATRVWSAVKTGTSKDMRDNWCIGFTSRYTIGVWVGNFSGEPMWNVSGVSGAAPAWREVVHRLHANQPSQPVAPPKGIVRQMVKFTPAVEPPRREVFLAGTETAVIEQTSTVGNPILYPTDGEIIALDPDIPVNRQRVRFEADTTGQWLLNGKPLGQPASAIWWQPLPGQYRLGFKGGLQPEKTIRFEVRGTLRRQ